MAHIDLIKYPFVAGPSDFSPSRFGLPRDTDSSTIISIIIRGALDRLREIFPLVLTDILSERMRVNTKIFMDEYESIACYKLLLAVAKSIGDRKLINRIALAYAKSARRSLFKEDDSVILSIASKIGLHLVYVENPPALPVFTNNVGGGKNRARGAFLPLNYSLPVIEFTGIVAERLSQDPAYSLENNVVSEGKVYMNKRMILRILEEAVIKHIITDAASMDISSLNIPLQDFIDKAREKLVDAGWFKSITARGTMETSEVGGLITEALPPCISRIISIVESGGNPSHEERFNLAAFLANIGLDVDSILEYFRKTPDFNEKIARYQVEHISGMKGSRKKYMPYSCEKMKSTNICPISDRCKGGRNPLSVYRYNLKRGLKRER
ncbi:DNA primase, large subunit [Desulfurococcus amylolyticus 1221n]|uniref:DNA primase large subunit PriL n=1 Tax=Desulfurococcus amylolyticus (strain DSM 18924 / JCM 16383 / VKM B-2413 / 1221n) TaxID=490899 RepID=B8D543_DESA1|nr:DNA primase [Desulfurococcus amylolyticus]ACL11224.1 DNA primase, large subunit [Desulfurococcus amylolyticus 1221n]